MSKREDVTGKKFGRLVATRRIGTTPTRNSLWEFRCECGENHIANLNEVKRKITNSCGCYRRDYCRKRMTTHGEGGKVTITPEYRIWNGMKDRCFRKDSEEFNYYGGRGITVCDTWKLSFEKFLLDMGRRPSEKHSIDRINNDDGYYKENCRWATKSEQAENRRKIIYRRGHLVSSEFVGVCWSNRAKKWIANIKRNGKKNYLGRFGDEMEAHEAINKFLVTSK